MVIKYTKVSAIKQLAKEIDRRCGQDFIAYLDKFIEQKIIKACKEHNGGKKTLDEFMAIYTFGKI